MSKLTLSDKLHFYLPQRLQILSPNGTPYIMGELNANGDISCENGMYYANGKPFFRPLSSLTKEITVAGYNGGKPFVPIVEIAKIHDPHLPEDFECSFHDYSANTLSTEKQYATLKYDVPTGNMGVLKYEFSYWGTLQRFSLKDTTRNMSLGVARQLEMFQLLLRFHFFLWDFEAYEKEGLILKIED